MQFNRSFYQTPFVSLFLIFSSFFISFGCTKGEQIELNKTNNNTIHPTESIYQVERAFEYDPEMAMKLAVESAQTPEKDRSVIIEKARNAKNVQWSKYWIALNEIETASPYSDFFISEMYKVSAAAECNETFFQAYALFAYRYESQISNFISPDRTCSVSLGASNLKKILDVWVSTENLKKSNYSLTNV
jgi:hypothetical protein